MPRLRVLSDENETLVGDYAVFRIRIRIRARGTRSRRLSTAPASSANGSRTWRCGPSCRPRSNEATTALNGCSCRG